MATKKSAHYQVFVSHATADKWLAKTLCEKIEQIGLATTFRDDRDISGGEAIPEEIRKQIENSKELLVLLTPFSIESEWVRMEIGAAWYGRKRIVTVRCHVPVDKIPGIIKDKKSIDLNEVDQYLRELADRVRSFHEKRR